MPAPKVRHGRSTLSAVWRKLLGLEQLGVDDNFFDLGGDSILLVQAHGELQQLLKRNFR